MSADLPRSTFAINGSNSGGQAGSNYTSLTSLHSPTNNERSGSSKGRFRNSQDGSSDREDDHLMAMPLGTHRARRLSDSGLHLPHSWAELQLMVHKIRSELGLGAVITICLTLLHLILFITYIVTYKGIVHSSRANSGSSVGGHTSSSAGTGIQRSAWQAAGSVPVSRIGFGSCTAYDLRPQPVWTEVRWVYLLGPHGPWHMHACMRTCVSCMLPC